MSAWNLSICLIRMRFYGKAAVSYYKAIDIVKGMANARPCMPYSYGFRSEWYVRDHEAGLRKARFCVDHCFVLYSVDCAVLRSIRRADVKPRRHVGGVREEMVTPNTIPSLTTRLLFFQGSWSRRAGQATESTGYDNGVCHS